MVPLVSGPCSYVRRFFVVHFSSEQSNTLIEQFNGSGSYGNGAGMRAHPIALACYNDDPEEVVKIAGDVAKLTHYHHLGMTGGIMQTMAVYHALHAESPHEILQKIKVLVNDLEKSIEEDSASLYKHKI